MRYHKAVCTPVHQVLMSCACHRYSSEEQNGHSSNDAEYAYKAVFGVFPIQPVQSIVCLIVKHGYPIYNKRLKEK